MATHSFMTGTNGFIGSHLVDALLERGDEVTGLVRRTSDLRRLVPIARKYPGRLNLVVGDLRDPDSLTLDFSGVDYVFHLAGELMATSEKGFRTSIVDGTKNLLDAVKASRSGQLKCFVYISSQAAMGPSPSSEPVDETFEPHPISWYGTAKRDTERLVREAGGEGLPVTIVRPCAVYGETEVDLSGGAFPVVRMGLTPKVGIRSRTATFVYVGDVVRGILAAAENQVAQGKTYILAEPPPRSPSDFGRAAAEAFGTKVRIPLPVPVMALYPVAIGSELLRIFFGGRPQLTRDKHRELRQRHWSAISRAAHTDLGWSSEVTLNEGVRRQAQTWQEERRAEDPVRNEPLLERIFKTSILTLIMGMILEALSFGTGAYHFLDAAPWPRDLDWGFVVAFWLLAMGSAAWLTAGLPVIAQIVLGGGLLTVIELVNDYWLKWWEFVIGTPLGDIPGPEVRAVVLGLIVGLVGVAVPNMINSALFKRRLRTG